VIRNIVSGPNDCCLLLTVSYLSCCGEWLAVVAMVSNCLANEKELEYFIYFMITDCGVICL